MTMACTRKRPAMDGLTEERKEMTVTCTMKQHAMGCSIREVALQWLAALLHFLSLVLCAAAQAYHTL